MIHFRKAFYDLDKLATGLSGIRDKLYEEAINKAKTFCKIWDFDTTLRQHYVQEAAEKCPLNWLKMLMLLDVHLLNSDNVDLLEKMELVSLIK